MFTKGNIDLRSYGQLFFTERRERKRYFWDIISNDNGQIISARCLINTAPVHPVKHTI